MYAIFYIIANEYPLRPVVYGDVMMQEMVTLVNFEQTITSLYGGIVLILMIILIGQ